MRKKLLTVTLTIFMALSLIACSGDKKDSDETDAMKTAVEETVEEPEVVELTADTIDKYYGFEYSATAPDSMSAFSVSYDTGASSIDSFSIQSVPAKYSEATISYKDPDYPYENRFIGGFYVLYRISDGSVGAEGKSRWLDGADEYASLHPCYQNFGIDGSRWGINNDGFDAFLAEIETNNIASILGNDNMYCAAAIAPYEIRDAISTDAGNHLEVTNNSGSFVSVMDCDVTYFTWPMTWEDYLVTVAGSITVNSKLSEVVAANAPTSGTLDTSGNVVLTWLTESGTTVDITFDATTEQPIVVSIVAATK